jgi:negative regulator of flagellin synthesis FlgM
MDVSTKIGSFQNRPGQIGSGKISTGKPAEQSNSSSEPASTAASVSNVNVSDQARQLAALDSAVKAAPTVNEARVAKIRESVENGTYQVAPERIADKLLTMENVLSQIK